MSRHSKRHGRLARGAILISLAGSRQQQRLVLVIEVVRILHEWKEKEKHEDDTNVECISRWSAYAWQHEVIQMQVYKIKAGENKKLKKKIHTLV